DAGVIQRVRGAVRVNPEGIDRGLVTGRVGAHRVGRVRDDRVDARGAYECHVRHRVHGQSAAVLALGHALGQDAGRGAVGHAHAVTDEQNDVLGLAWTGRKDLPGDGSDL